MNPEELKDILSELAPLRAARVHLEAVRWTHGRKDGPVALVTGPLSRARADFSSGLKQTARYVRVECFFARLDDPSAIAAAIRRAKDAPETRARVGDAFANSVPTGLGAPAWDCGQADGRRSSRHFASGCVLPNGPTRAGDADHDARASGGFTHRECLDPVPTHKDLRGPGLPPVGCALAAGAARFLGSPVSTPICPFTNSLPTSPFPARAVARVDRWPSEV
jgi:hypothetical protein